MRRWGIALLVLVGGAGAAVVTVGRGGGPRVPTVKLARAAFIRSVTAEGNLRATKATPITAPPDVQTQLKIAWLAKDGSPVKKDDVLVRFDPTDFEKQLADGEADRSSANAKIDKERMQSATALRGRDRTAELAGEELKKTRAFAEKDPLVFSRSQIVAAQIDEGLSSSRVDHASAAQRIEGRLSRSKIEILEVERRKAELAVGSARKTLRSLAVAAPHDGIVVVDRDWRGTPYNVGDSVWPGMRIAELPLLDTMEAEVWVLEADAGGLAVGGTAEVTLEAHPERAWKAKIKRIDALAKPRVRDVPVQYFGLTLELERTDPEVMKPGQRVHARLSIDAGKVITVPRQCVFEKDGRPVVYRLAGERFDAVPVKLGASSPGRVAVDEGVREGDRVALRDPTRPEESWTGAGGQESGPKPGAGP